MRRLKVAVVFGTRPEAIKMAPIVKELERRTIPHVTDSGGIQEEAPSLGKPVLVLRTTTERPEAIEAGTAKLVGTDRRRIIEETQKLLSNRNVYQAMATKANPYGDGKAAGRIVDILTDKLG